MTQNTYADHQTYFAWQEGRPSFVKNVVQASDMASKTLSHWTLTEGK